MNTLSQIGKQISEVFTTMTPASRIMAGLMLAVVVISLGWIINVQQTSSYEYLFGGQIFSEYELKRAEQAFGDASLRDYKRDGMRISVPAGEKDVYLKALSTSNALPQEWGSHIDRALSSTNPFESTELLAMRHQAALDRELARQFETMPDVENASVRYSEERRGFGRETQKSANVAVRALGNKAIDNNVLKSIAETTASYYAGLKLDDVLVTDLGSGRYYRSSSDPNSPDQHPYLQAQAEWELKYEEQLRKLLNIYGDVKLAVAVELDPTLQKESEQLKYDPTITTLQSSTSKKDIENSKPSIGGRPGAEPNVASNTPMSVTPAAIQAMQSAKTKETAENVQGVTGHEATVTKRAGLVPQRVSITVGIPESYYRKVWLARYLNANPDKTADDMPPLAETELSKLETEAQSNVRSAVESLLLAARAGDDRFPNLQVYSYPDLPGPPVVLPTTSELATTWLAQSWSTLALMGIVLIALAMMFTWVRSQTVTSREREFSEGFGLSIPPEMADQLDLGELPEDSEEEGAMVGDGLDSARKVVVRGAEMKSDLSTMVKENPDAAVNLLKTWIGEAA